jgi:hypothetical protein
MDQNEKRIIDDLFGKLREAENRTGPRDAEAERHIAGLLASQPAAPYYMAQAIVVQEQALTAAQERIRELEQELRNRPAGGGFLAGLFGGGRPEPAPVRRHGPGASSGFGTPSGVARHAAPGPWGRPGGSFIGGALQTAMAVAGGVVVGNMIADLLTPDPAMAVEPDTGMGGEPVEEFVEEPAEEAGYDDWGDFGDNDF